LRFVFADHWPLTSDFWFIAFVALLAFIASERSALFASLFALCT
jgi:hypothetical protein